MEASSVIKLNNVSIYQVPKGAQRVFSKSRRMPGTELVLSDVTFSIGRGELVYLIGRVGSGKSTLLKTLYGENRIASGSGQVAGYDLMTLSRKQIPYLRRRMGIVFQDYRLLTDRNVFYNLHYVMKATGWRNETDLRRRIEEVLEMVGLVNKEYKMPYELSGGEQQRLAIARALVNNPEVILADEPTGNLDPAAADAVMNIFRRIVQGGCSVVMSTHNVTLIGDFPSRTLRVMQGRVEEIDVRSILGI